MTYVLKSDAGAVIAQSENPIAYSVERAAWQVGDMLFADPGAGFVVEQMAEPAKVSPVQFKLLFTGPERVAIKAARATDPVIDDFYSIVEDPRLTHVDLGLQSSMDALAYMVGLGLLTDERKSEILTGNLV